MRQGAGIRNQGKRKQPPIPDRADEIGQGGGSESQVDCARRAASAFVQKRDYFQFKSGLGNQQSLIDIRARIPIARQERCSDIGIWRLCSSSTEELWQRMRKQAQWRCKLTRVQLGMRGRHDGLQFDCAAIAKITFANANEREKPHGPGCKARWQG